MPASATESLIASRIIYAPRGETAGWLSWPLAALGRPEGRPMLAGLKLCLGRNALFTGAPEARLEAVAVLARLLFACDVEWFEFSSHVFLR
jgi:hypothetical protein